MKNKHLYRDTNKDTYMPDRTRAALAQALNALEKLARLGNGDQYGNSLGNMIARDALTAAEAALATPQEPVASLMTNVQSGDMEIAWSADGFEREIWHETPLYPGPRRAEAVLALQGAE